MTEMKDLVEIRYKTLEEEISDRWMWVKSDTGAWEGPFTDWQRSHKHKYFTHVKKYDVVVTAGGNCGAYTRAYANRFRMVYSFEPDWLNYYCLSYNNPYENVFTFHAGLGETPGLCSLQNYNKSNTGALKFTAKEEGDVPMLNIDSLGLSACDLIQLDVENYELEVLKGALQTIQKFKPVIICERDQHTVNTLLTELGYHKGERSIADQIYNPQ